MMNTNNELLPETRGTAFDTPLPSARDPSPADRSQPRRLGRRPRRAQPSARHRRTWKALPLITLSAWSFTDFLTLGLGAILIVGMLLAVAGGITWVILPGAAATLFAIVSTLIRWDRMRPARRLSRLVRARRANRWRKADELDTDAGGIVHLPDWQEPPRRVG